MKISATVTTILLFFLLINCHKSSTPVAHINCEGLVTDTLGTGDSGKIFVPNAFTPNNDGRDDYFGPRTFNISSLEFTIYDANNNVVFTTTELGKAWNPGSLNNTNTEYYYKVQAVTSGNHKIGKCGHVYSLTCFPKEIPRDSFYFADQLTALGYTLPMTEPIITCP